MRKAAFVLLFSIFFSNVSSAGQVELEAIGGLGGANIYLTYVAMGAIADGFSKKVYDKSTAVKVTNEILGLAKNSRTHVQKLLDDNILTGEDIEFGKKMLEVFDLLLKQGDAAITFYNTGKGANDFQNYRTKAWNSLTALLGIGK